MKNILYQKQWHWSVSGLALGVSFFWPLRWLNLLAFQHSLLF